MILYDEGIRLSEEDIIYYEKELKIKFPPRYAEFLLESNGGTPEEDLVFDFVDSAIKLLFCVISLLHIMWGSISDIQDVMVER